MARRAQPAVAARKEGNLFQEGLKLYEDKHYKKSIKICDQVLKKSNNKSSYAEALALKALNLFFLKELNESKIYAAKAIQKDESCAVSNHILGILARARMDYKEAAYFFKKALDNGSYNKQIWRELGAMEVHNRDYKAAVKSRHTYLEDFLGYRANWTSLAVAHHLNKDYDAAERTLAKFEELAKGKLSEAEMFENSELELYKNQMIYESGDVERALKDLNGLDTFDKTQELEWKGKYYLKLGDTKNASKVFRTLLKRNPDNIKYYNFLEMALGTLGKSAKFRDGLYQKLVKFYPRSDPPRFIPLFFTEGDLFVERASKYVLSQLDRGVPTAFTNIKPLYKSQPEKIPIVEKIVLDYYENIKEPLNWVWTTYFLSQHYLFLKDLNKARELIEKAIEHTPTLVELYILKARILKHYGDAEGAAEVINKGRLIDLQDRFINTKTVKYYLRSNDINKATEICSIFTKNDEDCKNGLKDLHMMQVNWFLIENAEAYLRLYELAIKEKNKENIVKYGGLALKRFKAIVKVFEEYYNDQLDFHTFCMRKGTARAYIDMIHWEDHVFASPVYARAVKGASEILLLNEKPELADTEGEEVQDKKKDKKERAARAKRLDAEKAELIAYPADEDSDVFGETLFKAENWITLFQDEYFHHLLEQGDSLLLTHDLNFHLNFRLKKIPISVAALTKLKNLSDFKYDNLPSYLLKLKFRLGEEGLNKILAEKLLSKNFPDFEFDDVDAIVKKYLNLDTVKGLLGLVNIVNLKLDGVNNDEYKQLVLKKIETFEPIEQVEILKALK